MDPLFQVPCYTPQPLGSLEAKNVLDPVPPFSKGTHLVRAQTST